jgi:predicted polyphosphate/ATP-dependent NAD kinase
VRAGVARAVGEPSPTLLREAQQEREYVVKDFRRIGVVVAIMAALLVVSDIAVNALLP